MNACRVEFSSARVHELGLGGGGVGWQSLWAPGSRAMLAQVDGFLPILKGFDQADVPAREDVVPVAGEAP